MNDPTRELPPVLDPRLTLDAPRATRARAIDRARDTAFSQLAAGVAYELEGLAAACVAHLAEAFEAAAQDGAPTHAIAQAQHALDSMAATVRGLKAFTTEDGRASTLLNVHDPLELALRLSGPSVRARAMIERRYAPLPPVHASLPGLTRVFVEILRNAGESIPAGTPDANHIVVHTTQDPSGRLVVEVSDTGVGIEPEDLPFVFDPFFTTKEGVRGGGLGLTVARAEVRALGGELTVESLVGRGTRVRVTLPPAETARFVAGVPTLVTRESAPSRILAVSATQAAARHLARPFADGHVIVFPSTWTEALERLALGEPFDLIVSDAHAAGCETFRARLREYVPDARSRVFDLARDAADDSGVFPRVATAG